MRDTKYWTDLQRDPVFRFRRGMVAVRFSGSHHEYFTYRCSRRIGPNWYKEREIVPIPSDTSLVDITKPRHVHPSAGPAREADLPPKPIVNGKRNYREPDDFRRGMDVKRPRTTTFDQGRTPPRLPRRPSSPPLEFDTNNTWGPPSHEPRSHSPHRTRSSDDHSRSPGGHRPPANDSRRHDRSAAPSHRHDSGYHSSAHSAEKRRSWTDNHKANGYHLSPPLPLSSSASRKRTHERDVSRERVRTRDRDRDRDRDRSRERSRDRGRRDRQERGGAWSPPPPRYGKSHYSKSPSRSQTATPGDDSDNSNLSDLEYELLGMKRPEKKKKSPPPPKMVAKKKQRPKVNDAFRYAFYLLPILFLLLFHSNPTWLTFFCLVAVAAGEKNRFDSGFPPSPFICFCSSLHCGVNIYSHFYLQRRRWGRSGTTRGGGGCVSPGWFGERGREYSIAKVYIYIYIIVSASLNLGLRSGAFVMWRACPSGWVAAFNKLAPPCLPPPTLFDVFKAESFIGACQIGISMTSNNVPKVRRNRPRPFSRVVGHACTQDFTANARDWVSSS